MTFAIVFLVNAGLSFALSLVVAALVGPDLFGRYALALSASVVLATGAFEWLRLSAARFYSAEARTARPEIRATLDAGYAAVSALTIAGAVALLASGIETGLSPALLAAAAASGLAAGWFDFRVALARARFLDRPYAILLLARGVASFAVAAGIGLGSGDPALILAGSAAASLAVAVAGGRALRDPDAGLRRARPELAGDFARYAVPLVAASAVYLLLPLGNRAVLASRSGFAEAGHFALVGEIAMRLFQNLGSALDIALFQLAVRAEAVGGPEAGERQVARNAATVLAVTVPAALGLCLVWPSFEILFIPSTFRGRLGGLVPLIVPALAAYAVVQYALNPLFQLRRRTGPVILAALLGLAVNALALLLWPSPSGPEAVAVAQLAGFATSALCLAVQAVRAGARLPGRDTAKTAAASLAMAAALLPTLGWAPGPATLALQIATGATVYAAAAVALDLAGGREIAGAFGRRLRTTVRR